MGIVLIRYKLSTVQERLPCSETRFSVHVNDKIVTDWQVQCKRDAALLHLCYVSKVVPGLCKQGLKLISYSYNVSELYVTFS